MTPGFEKEGFLVFRRRPFVVSCLISIALFLVLGGWLGTHVQALRDTVYDNLSLFSQVLSLVQSRYVEPVDSQQLIYSAVRGMLSALDPHTQFLEAKDYRDLMVNTEGSFGGIGIQIDIRDGWLTVISPLEGTPAYRLGLQPGDRIVRIEGKSTRGITTDGAIAKLRGEPGTTVTITIEREGESAPLDYSITRARIEVKSVPYSGMIAPGIGYVRLSTFSKESGKDLARAIDSLESDGLQGLILDLRYNVGGLLDQAVDVSSLFLKEGELVVSTKGRVPESNQEFRSKGKGKYIDRPLVVLVNFGSASASEIVAGAIQDWDRGLVLGGVTFGKGSVQTVMQLPQGTALKLTTAKYYTPSGRCIHRESTTAEEESESLTPPESLAVPRETFRTVGGLKRTVYGGGGINPDLAVDVPRLSSLETELERNNFFFKFAVHYTVQHKDMRPDFAVDEAMLTDFRGLLASSKLSYDAAELAKSEPYVKRGIKREIVHKLWGSNALYEYNLTEDEQVGKARELLSKARDLKSLFRMAAEEAAMAKPAGS
jgi:carboxyl-terminal processing protease